FRQGVPPTAPGPSARSSSASTAGTEGMRLGTDGFATVVVDDARGRVLVSAPNANAVRVADLSGHDVATIQNVYGAFGMVIDGDVLYVAQSTVGSVARIDLTTLRPSHPATIGSGMAAPTWLALSGGRLWTTVGSDDTRRRLTSIDLS